MWEARENGTQRGEGVLVHVSLTHCRVPLVLQLLRILHGKVQLPLGLCLRQQRHTLNIVFTLQRHVLCLKHHRTRSLRLLLCLDLKLLSQSPDVKGCAFQDFCLAVAWLAVWDHTAKHLKAIVNTGPAPLLRGQVRLRPRRR